MKPSTSTDAERAIGSPPSHSASVQHHRSTHAPSAGSSSLVTTGRGSGEHLPPISHEEVLSERGKRPRRIGREGETTAKALLTERDYDVVDCSAGLSGVT